MPYTRTTIYLGDKERRDIKTIQTRYGLASLSDGIRLAIRVLASLSAEQGKVVEQFKPRGRKRAEAALGIEAVIAQAKRISAEAEQVRAKSEATLAAARATATKATAGA